VPLANNIIWQNRSFYWELNADGTFGLVPDISAGDDPVYDDLAVLGAAGPLAPFLNILTDTTGYSQSNIASDPEFVFPYFNGNRQQAIAIPEPTTGIQAQPAFDEGGNFISVRFGPLTLSGDYHIQGGSPAINAGTGYFLSLFPDLQMDYDGEPRSAAGGESDIGADEVQ
jgi:hypothetical protein